MVKPTDVETTAIERLFLKKKERKIVSSQRILREEVRVTPWVGGHPGNHRGPS